MVFVPTHNLKITVNLLNWFFMKNLIYFLAFIGVFFTLSVSHAQSDDAQPGMFRNPLNPDRGADPWIQYYDGNYYMATTTWSSELLMRQSPTLAGLKTAIPQQIYFETEPSRCCNMWAPEFHLLEGEDGLRWYFYYTAGTAGTLDNQHSHVLESAGLDPMGPYTYKARIFDSPNDGWSIDGSILKIDEDLYFLFSSWVGDEQKNFIAPMSNPWTISGSRVLLSEPEYEWERMDLNVNEAPVALYHDDDIFVVYSASHCATPYYKLGMLTYLGGDPLNPESWEKHPEPIFEQSPENGVFGSAHNGFFKSPDGTEDWIIYHANDSAEGGCDNARTTRAQPIRWNDDGTPDLGIPVATTEVIPAPSGDNGVDPLTEFAQFPISRFRSMARPNTYLEPADLASQAAAGVQPIGDSQFYVVPGLANPEAISLRSVNFPSYFLRHDGNLITLAPDDGSEQFAADATWWVRPGLADDSGISFESYNQTRFYIGRQFTVAALVEFSETMAEPMMQDATFFEEHE